MTCWRAGARLVLTDSARRRTFTAPRLRANRGPTLGPDDPVSGDSPLFDPFPGRGTAGRTVALYTGLRRIYSPAQPGFEQFPQYRPYAAMDGRRDTSWLADQHVPSSNWWLQVDLARPRAVDSLEIIPHATRARPNRRRLAVRRTAARAAGRAGARAQPGAGRRRRR